MPAAYSKQRQEGVVQGVLSYGIDLTVIWPCSGYPPSFERCAARESQLAMLVQNAIRALRTIYRYTHDAGSVYRCALGTIP